MVDIPEMDCQLFKGSVFCKVATIIWIQFAVSEYVVTLVMDFLFF